MNPILASKHTLGRSFQVIFCIEFFKAKFICKPFITSTIYRIIKPLCQRRYTLSNSIDYHVIMQRRNTFSNTKENKRKKEKKKQARHLCFLANLELNLHSNISFFFFFFFLTFSFVFPNMSILTLNFSHSFMRFLYASLSRLYINEIYICVCVCIKQGEPPSPQ